MKKGQSISRFYHLRTIRGIYTIVCPVTYKVVYVGQCFNAQYRFEAHINSRKNPKTPLAEWIKNTIDKGNFPLFYIVETVAQQLNINPFEKKWIHYYLKSYPDLFNIVHTSKNPCIQTNDNRKHRAKKITI